MLATGSMHSCPVGTARKRRVKSSVPLSEYKTFCGVGVCQRKFAVDVMQACAPTNRAGEALSTRIEVVKFLNEPCRIFSFLGIVGPIHCQIWIHQTLHAHPHPIVGMPTRPTLSKFNPYIHSYLYALIFCEDLTIRVTRPFNLVLRGVRVVFST